MAVLSDKERNQRKENLKLLEKKLKGFKQTQFAFTDEYTKEILIDSVNKRIGIIDSNLNFVKQYRYEQIKGVTICEVEGESVDKIDSIQLKINVNDYNITSHIFEFSTGTVQKNSSDYKLIIKRVDYWYKLLEHPETNVKIKPSVINKQTNIESSSNGCLPGCLSLIGILLLLMILTASCGDTGGSNYQPGDFDFDGDSGDFDDAVKFLEWKMNQENE